MRTDRAMLLAQAKCNKDEALGELLEQYRNYLKLLAGMELGRRMRRKVDPSDLVQETFLDAHRNFPNFVGTTEPQFTNWLRQILATNASNLLRQYLGTQARDIRLEEDLTTSFQNSGARFRDISAPSAESPSQDAMGHEQEIELANAISQLPDDYREVIVLRHWEAKSFPEIATQMGRSLDSVEKLWMRGVMRLRASMGERQ
ncbi:MAG TPA: sigma-70 family RNA polymerase sigma factor [Pirellulales bacterium]|jgi:RNA polymerase sigma-70 factor (ECF subfamily)